MVAVGLRFLTGGLHHDIGSGYDISSAAFHTVVDTFVDEIHGCQGLDLDSPFREF